MVKFIQGDVVGVYNSAGTKLVTFKYDAYGNCTMSGDAVLAQYCKIRYRGYYFDAETGFYWVQTRYYNPQWCRWISPDSLSYLDPETAHGLNLYAYCGNDPVNFADPSGHLAFFILTAIIGAVIGVGITAAVDYADNKQFDLHWGWYLGAGLLGALIGASIGAITSALLTGSFGSNISSVFAGAKLLGNMAKAGGLHASAIMVLDNFRNALHQPTHVFWSGGDIAMNGGKSLAQNIDGITLEMTKLGQYLTNHNASIDVWKIASANFAQQVSPGGVVFSVQNITGLSITGTWATIEFPILAKRGIDILYLMLGEL